MNFSKLLAKTTKLPIVLIALIFTISISFSFYVGIQYESRQIRKSNDGLITFKETRTNSTPTPEIMPLENFISFILPSGWKAKKDLAVGPTTHTEYVITSPDYKKTNTFDWPGLMISISMQEDNLMDSYEARYQELYDEENSNKNIIPRNVTQVTINGNKALEYTKDWEGHLHAYEIWNGGRIWSFYINTPIPDQESPYKNSIQSILNSLVFK